MERGSVGVGTISVEHKIKIHSYLAIAIADCIVFMVHVVLYSKSLSAGSFSKV